MMDFRFFMPTKVIFGSGCIKGLSEAVIESGAERILLVSGRNSMRKTGMLDKVLNQLEIFDIEVFDSVEPDPSCVTVDAGAERASDVDLVIALGGGSAIDAAKAISLVSRNDLCACDLLDGVKAPFAGPDIIAIPTTAGTASEVTEVSVLTNRDKMVKNSFRSPYIYPKYSFVDPELTVSMPQEVTAHSGVDALTHAIEAASSKKKQAIPQLLCLEAVRLIFEFLPQAYIEPDDIQARQMMCLASVMAGFGITHSGAGLAHGLSYGLWKKTDISHGLSCGVVLADVMRFNSGFEDGVYQRLAQYIGERDVPALIGRVEGLLDDVGIRGGLSTYGLVEGDIDEIVKNSFSSSTKSNPRKVTEEDLSDLLRSMI